MSVKQFHWEVLISQKYERRRTVIAMCVFERQELFKLLV